MCITPRDKIVIHQIARFRFLRSTQIVRLVSGAPDKIVRRLQALYHHGWLDRPRCQIEYFHRGGSRPLVYGLSGRGASLMRREFGMSFGGMVWSGKKGCVGRLFLDHTLMVADILIAVQLACGEHAPDRKFVSSEELEENCAREDAFRWSVSIDGGLAGLVPDGVFGIETRDQTGATCRVVCFLEADRGTMPIHRRDNHQSSIGRKLAAYSALWKNGDFEKRFGTKRFAVFIVTTGKTRAGKMNEALSSLRSGKGLFSCQALDEVLDNADVILQRCAANDNVR